MASVWAYALDIRNVIKAAANLAEANDFLKMSEVQFTDSLFRMED
jgi:hypothetical protein